MLITRKQPRNHREILEEQNKTEIGAAECAGMLGVLLEAKRKDSCIR